MVWGGVARYGSLLKNNRVGRLVGQADLYTSVLCRRLVRLNMMNTVVRPDMLRDCTGGIVLDADEEISGSLRRLSYLIHVQCEYLVGAGRVVEPAGGAAWQGSDEAQGEMRRGT